MSDITEACPSALILAQQLTHIELERLSYIGPEEFVQAFAKDNLEATYKDLKKTNNLESYVQWFNRLSYLVATQACSVSLAFESRLPVYTVCVHFLTHSLTHTLRAADINHLMSFLPSFCSLFDFGVEWESPKMSNIK